MNQVPVIFQKTETPTLTKNFAGIGSRDIENYNVQKDGKWQPRKEYVGKEKEEKAKQAIREVYEKTKESVSSIPAAKVEVKVELSEKFSKAQTSNGVLTKEMISSNESLLLLTNKLANKIKNNIGITMQVSLQSYDKTPRSQGGKLNRILDLRN